MRKFLQLIRPFREMRNVAFFSLVLFALIAIPMGMRGQTNVTWPGTTALPGTASAVANDQNVTIMVSSTNTYSNPIRVYANTTVTINALNGAKILSVAYEASSTGNYVTNAQNATVSPNVTPTVSNTIVTWTYAESANVTEFTFKPSAQTRSNGITITYIIPSATPTCATPTFNPVAGTYTQAQTVSISCATEGATIYYTTNGDNPTVNSTVYAEPISVSADMTIKAMATASGYDNSSVATAEYAFITLDHAGTLSDPYTVADARAAIDANAGTQGVYATGIVSEITTAYDSEYGNVTFDLVDEEGNEYFLRAYRCGGDEAANVAVGDVAVVYGNLTKYGSIYEFAQGCEVVSLTHPAITTPTVTVTPNTINAPAEGADGTLVIAYENIPELISFDYYFCDANGGELEGNDPDWIYAEINEPGEEEHYTVSYIIDANQDAARTAYFKVYTTIGDELNPEEVYAIVTVNQEEYVAPTYAELPFEFNGGRAAIDSIDGFYQEGLGTDYNANTNPYTKLKFDGTGDWLLLQFDERPGILTYDIKGNSFSGGTFKVQTSEDGTVYTDLKTYTSFGTDVESEEFPDLNENVRYIKWIYTAKASGNVGLGNITLAEYVEPVIEPSITIAPDVLNLDAAMHTFEVLSLTYENMEFSGYGTDIFSAQFYDAEGEEIDSPDWCSAGAALMDEEESVYQVLVGTRANEGEARTTYFKLFAYDADSNLVYSNLVTINQAAAPQQYTLTVDPFENLDLITFVNDEMVLEGDGEIQVNDGDQVMLSVVALEGYVMETLMVNGVNHVNDIAEDFTYSFEMPAEDVVISATAGTPQDYELFSGDLVEGDYLIVYDGGAMNHTVLSDRLQYETVTATDGIISTSNAGIVWHIAPSGNYWTIYSADAEAYAASTGAKNKAQMLEDGTDDKALWTVTVSEGTYEFVNKQNTTGQVNANLRRNGTYGFACYATATGGALSLYKKVEEIIEEPCDKILVNANNTSWSEDFEDDAEGITNPYTGRLPQCWLVVEEYTSDVNDVTPPQVYYKPEFNAIGGGSYSLRMRFRSMLAMPELDEEVDFDHLKMSLYVRQSFWSYKLEIGVITDIDNPDESYHLVATVNNSDKNMNYFECNFSSVKGLVGEGRYIVFKNVGGSEGDLYSNNYLDNIMLLYVDEEEQGCLLAPDYTEGFEYVGVGMEPDCWEVITEDVRLESGTRPQVNGIYNTTEDGENSLRLKNRCVYAMPEFQSGYNVSDYTMIFQLRQPNSLYRLQVGVVDEQGEFTAVKTLKCSGTEFEEKTVNFSGYEGRIAFRNTLVPGTGRRTDYLDYSINYIDDIHFTSTEEDKIAANGENVLDTDLESIAVYPNPTTGNLYIDAIGIQKVECYNQMGQLVRVYDNVRNSIDLNNLSEGVYTLRITVPQGVTMRKVVKR